MSVQHNSLLWPQGDPATSARQWQESTVVDLGLEGLINVLNVDGKHDRDIKRIILTPCDDVETIRYRQEIIEDLLAAPELLQHFTKLLPLLSDLTYYAS